jgi:hypothetical protein
MLHVTLRDRPEREDTMAKSYVVGFENVELVDGLAPDKAVWLYMRATLLNDGDPDHPVWIGEVGSLPPDANRPGFDGFPHGDAGRYAAGLMVGQPVTSESEVHVLNFTVGPVEVGPGQTLEVMVIMLPLVWMETVSVPPEALDRLAYGVFGAAIGSIGGPVGALAGLIFGLFAPQDQNVDVPCFNSVIMARNVFTAADLDRIETEGFERFGPQDNESYVVCHQPIDAYYSLSVNPRSFSFAPTPPANRELCRLEPRAYEAEEDQLVGQWGDVGDRISDCIQVLIDPRPPRHADVTVLRRAAGGYQQIGQFTNVPITRGVPHPDFMRNFYDDACPARSVTPDCPQCASFDNLPMAMMVHPGLLYLGMTAGSHIGSKPVFPMRTDTDRMTTPRPALRDQVAPAHAARRHGAAATHARAAARSNLPIRFGDRHLVQRIDDTHVRLWPTGTVPVRDQKFSPALSDVFIDREVVLPAELPLSWLLVCSPEFTLATYQEIKGDGGCRKRLRYTRRDARAVIVADAMLTPLVAAVR